MIYFCSRVEVIFNVPFGFLLGTRQADEQGHVLEELLFSELVLMTSSKTTEVILSVSNAFTKILFSMEQ